MAINYASHMVHVSVTNLELELFIASVLPDGAGNIANPVFKQILPKSKGSSVVVDIFRI